MTQIFGDYNDALQTSQEYLILGFSPTSIPLKQRWRNNGLSADFLADYLTTFFPASDSDQDSLMKQAEIKNAINYVANELLENAMKFNDDSSTHPINVQLQLLPDRIVFCITNSLSRSDMLKFQEFIQRVINSDPQELYLHQLEENAVNEHCNHSRLGLLTMINDYQATIGWKFKTVQTNPELLTVSTMVQLII
jgi:hypothetical protein